MESLTRIKPTLIIIRHRSYSGLYIANIGQPCYIIFGIIAI